MVEPQRCRRQSPVVEFVTDIARAEHAGGEADEGGEHDEDAVEIVNQQVRTGLRPLPEHRQRRKEGRERREHVELRGDPVPRQQRKDRRGESRNKQHREPARSVDSFAFSAEAVQRLMSTLSKRSRIRNRKMPMTMKAMRIEKATLISTTSGMPLAPVAASTRPFSSDMNPTTWLTALRRVTIISRPSSTTDSANARSSRASGSASCATRSITTIDRATRPCRRASSRRCRRPCQSRGECRAGDNPVQRDRNDDRFEDQRKRRGDVKMRRVLDIGLPGHREREHDGVQREHVEQRIEPVLIKLARS